MDEDAGRLEQVCPQQAISPSRDLTGDVGFPRLLAARGKPEISADLRRELNRDGSSIVWRNVKAVTTPTPGTLMSRLTVSSSRARRRTSSSSLACSWATRS